MHTVTISYMFYKISVASKPKANKKEKKNKGIFLWLDFSPVSLVTKSGIKGLEGWAVTSWTKVTTVCSSSDSRRGWKWQARQKATCPVARLCGSKGPHTQGGRSSRALHLSLGSDFQSLSPGSLLRRTTRRLCTDGIYFNTTHRERQKDVGIPFFNIFTHFFAFVAFFFFFFYFSVDWFSIHFLLEFEINLINHSFKTWLGNMLWGLCNQNVQSCKWRFWKTMVLALIGLESRWLD